MRAGVRPSDVGGDGLGIAAPAFFLLLGAIRFGNVILTLTRGHGSVVVDPQYPTTKICISVVYCARNGLVQVGELLRLAQDQRLLRRIVKLSFQPQVGSTHRILLRLLRPSPGILPLVDTPIVRGTFSPEGLKFDVLSASLMNFARLDFAAA